MENLRVEINVLKEIHRDIALQLQVDALDVESIVGRFGFRLLFAPITQCVAPPILYLIERVADGKSPQEIVSRHKELATFNKSWLSR